MSGGDRDFFIPMLIVIEDAEEVKRMLKYFRMLLVDDRGQGMVEYGLIIALVAVLLVGALVALRGGLDGIFGDITETLTNPGEAAAPQ